MIENSGEPLVSVIVPCFRQANFLPNALESVLRQSVRTEIVVVDDGSPDDVAQVCRRYDRIRYVRQEHQGLCAARNRGIAETHGPLVHFLDADDAAGAGMYTSLADALRRHSDWAAAVCGTRVLHEDGQPSPLKLDPPETANLFEPLTRKNCFPPGAVLLRRAMLEKTGLFDETLDATGDWDLWLRVARAGGVFGRVPAHLFEYRTYPWSMSRVDPDAMVACQKEVLLRARRADERVRDPDVRFARGASGEDLDDALANCIASSLGTAIGHRRPRGIVRMLRQFTRQLDGLCLMRHHLEIVLAEASVTLGILPPDRDAMQRACAKTLTTVREMLVDEPAPRVILEQIICFLDSGVFADEDGQPVVLVPVFGSMSADVRVDAPRVSRVTAVMAPWRKPAAGTVRLRIVDAERRWPLREAIVALRHLPAARPVCFAFEPLDGMAGRSLRLTLTPMTDRPLAVFEPAGDVRSFRRRLLRRVALDRHGRRLYCRLT